MSLFERCGWPAHVVSDCGSDIKKGIADTLLKAPKAASWISDITHVVANALKHYYADLSLFQQFQTLCTRIRGRLQQTKFAFLLPPKARVEGSISQWEPTGIVGPSNDRVFGGERTRDLGRGRSTGRCAARAQAV